MHIFGSYKPVCVVSDTPKEQGLLLSARESREFPKCDPGSSIAFFLKQGLTYPRVASNSL